MIFELSNQSIWKYNVQEVEKVKILRYENGGKYKWHTDCGSKETSLRKTNRYYSVIRRNKI